jgi:hypothetical protein
MVMVSMWPLINVTRSGRDIWQQKRRESVSRDTSRLEIPFLSAILQSRVSCCARVLQ